MSKHAYAGSSLRILGTWYKQELLLLREPIAVFFSLAFPLIIYLFIGVPYAEEIVPDSSVRFIDTIFPTLIGTVAANLLLMGLPIYVAELRARHVDKRYRVLPLPGRYFASSVILAMLTLLAAANAVVITVVGIANGLRPEILSLLFMLLNFGLIAFVCGVGFFLGTLPLGTRTIQALTAAIFFVLFFGSGSAVPLAALPQLVQDILEWNPLKIWFDSLVAVYTETDFPSDGVWKLFGTLVIAAALTGLGLRNWRRTE